MTAGNRGREFAGAWCRPDRCDSRKSPGAWLVERGEALGWVSNEGARIHFDVRGDGEPLVLIAGTGFDMTFWDDLLPVLEGFRVLRLDNRGCGQSSVPNEPFTIEVMARDVVAVMDAAGFGSAHVHGSSLGSLIAQELACRYPQRVRSLVLGATWPGVVSIPGALPLLPLLLRPARHGVEDDLRAATRYLTNTGVTNAAAAFPGHASAPRSAIGYRRQLRAQLRYSSLRRLPRIQSPTLVVHGSEDRLIPPANAKIVARLIPDARLRLVPGAGHLYQRDQPEESTRAVLDFLLAASAGVLDNAAVAAAKVPRPRLGKMTAVLLMTDLVASTATLSKVGDEQWAAIMDQHDSVVVRTLEASRGTLIKHTGDGVLATFITADEAVAAATGIAEGCYELGLQVRSGIHTGTCDVRHGDLSGLAVHVTARVMSLADASEVAMTEEVAAALTGKVPLTAHGQVSLRGLPEPVSIVVLKVGRTRDASTPSRADTATG